MYLFIHEMEFPIAYIFFAFTPKNGSLVGEKVHKVLRIIKICNWKQTDQDKTVLKFFKFFFKKIT